MKRVGHLWPELTSFANLLGAAEAAAKGKRRRSDVSAFLFHLEPYLFDLRAELLDGIGLSRFRFPATPLLCSRGSATYRGSVTDCAPEADRALTLGSVALAGRGERDGAPTRSAIMKRRRLRYFITFSCYGARLHGAESGSVDRNHNLVGSPSLEPDPCRVEEERREMAQDPYVLDEAARPVVLAAIQQHCTYRKWNLLAAHVRSNHVHVIVEAEIQPERIMNEFKSYASRELNRSGKEKPDRKRWTRHGSTRWLWKDEDVRRAIQYVVQEQGEPMALFIGGDI